MHTCMHTHYVHMCKCVYAYIYIYIYVHMYIHVYVYTYTNVYIYIYYVYTQTCKHLLNAQKTEPTHRNLHSKYEAKYLLNLLNTNTLLCNLVNTISGGGVPLFEEETLVNTLSGGGVPLCGP